jgi:hypothetical protein
MRQVVDPLAAQPAEVYPICICTPIDQQRALDDNHQTHVANLMQFS